VTYAPFIEVIKAFEKVSVQIQEMTEQSPVADESGLSPHEISTLVAIAEQTETPSSYVWPRTVIRAMNDAGYRNVAAALGMAGLERKGLVETFEVQEYNESGTAIRVNHNGWSWLESNIERLELRFPPNRAIQPEPGDDIPF
jgi:hypothetical protein